MRHRVTRTVCLVLGTLLAFLAILTLWIARQAIETDQWTQTSTKLLEQPTVQNAVAGFLTDELYANVDVSAELRAALPERAQPLAGPAAAALRSAIDDIAVRALASAPAQDAWERANRAAHEVFVQIVEGDGDVVATQGGVVTLDLKALLEELQQRTGVGGRAAALLPEDAAQLQILESDQLGTIQNVANALKPLAAVLVIAALIFFGVAIALSGERRRETVRAAGFGFILAGVGALVARSIIGDTIVDELAATEAAKPAIEDTFTVGTSLLAEVATATILYGAVAVAGAWFAGSSRAAVAMRQRVSPHLREPGTAYGGLAFVVLLLLWWAPTEGLRRPLTALVLIGLMAVATEALRRQAVRETDAAAAAEAPSPDSRPTPRPSRATAPRPRSQEADMCRWMAWLGQPVLIDELLFATQHGIVDQALHSRLGAEPTNGDGFGLGWYDAGDVKGRPGIYRSVAPAWNDDNLRELSGHVESHLFLAHVRAAIGSPVQQTNCHPFRNGRWLFVHNGYIGDFHVIRRDLMLMVEAELFPEIAGSTDTEVVFHLALTLGLRDDPIGALESTVGLIEHVARDREVEPLVQATFGISDGERLWAVRYATSGTPRSLFASADATAIQHLYPDNERFARLLPSDRLIVSEPFSDLPGVWREIPPSTAICADPGGGLQERPFKPRVPALSAAGL